MRPINPPTPATALVARAALCGLLLLGLGTGPVRAVDPLPPDIEQASPEVKARYLEMTNRQSLEEKLKVGERRYQDRIQTRQQIHQHMQTELAKRQEQIRLASFAPQSNSALSSFIRLTGILLGCAVGFTLFVRVWRRTSAG